MGLQKLIYGIGINDADYKVTIVEEIKSVNGKRRQREVWRCPFYSTWKNILTRCYSKSEHKRLPTYKNCEICNEWKYFSNFRKWMILQNWENKSLDKDLLLDDNKIYSPETCIFLESGLNSFLAKPKETVTYVGVTYNKRGDNYISRIYYNGKRKYLGTFENPFDAHRFWQKEKINIFNKYIDMYVNEPLIYTSLIRKRDSIQFDYVNHKPTK